MAGPHALPHQTEPHAPTDVRDLVPGLLVFFARPSLLQTWAEAFGHQWRHVGVTIQTDAGLMVASYGPKKCFRLDDPLEIMDAYDRVGVARVLYDDAELDRLHEFCSQFGTLSRTEAPYAFSTILVGPVHLAARRMRSGVRRSLLMWLVYAYCRLLSMRHRDRHAYVCSTFALAAILAARSTPIRLPLSAHPDDEAAYATEPTRRDDAYARWLCGPTELWNAISPMHRADLDLTDLPSAEELAALADPAVPEVVVVEALNDAAVGVSGNTVQCPSAVSDARAPAALDESAPIAAVIDLRRVERGFDALERAGPPPSLPVPKSDVGRAA